MAPVDDDRTRNLRIQRHAQRQPFVRRGFGHDVLQVGQQLREIGGSSSMSRRPASIFDRSRTSLIRSSSCEPQRPMASNRLPLRRVHRPGRAA
jgi:hypothetical protein